MRFALIAAPLLTLALASCGQPDTPGGRIADERHENFETIGKAFKLIIEQSKAKSPDVEVIQSAAATINGFAPKVATWFPAGSAPADGVRTDALPAIWAKPAEFKAATDKFVEEAAKFNTLAATGDAAAIGKGVGALGGTCKGCHDKFREPE